MDERLQKLKRQALSDPEAQIKYIAMLERLVGEEVLEKLSLWVVSFVPERTDLTYTLGIYLTKTLAQKAAVENIISMMQEDINAREALDTEVGDDDLARCRSYYDEGQYEEAINFFEQTWCDYSHEVRIEEMSIIS